MKRIALVLLVMCLAFTSAKAVEPSNTGIIPPQSRTVYTAPYAQNFNGSWLPADWSTWGGRWQWEQYNSSWAVCWLDQYTFGYPQYLRSPFIQIPSYLYRLEFKWSHLYNSEYPFDLASVEIQTQAGQSEVIWQKYGSAFNSNDGATASAPGSGVLESIDLTRYAGETVQITFVGTQAINRGWFIDDFNVHYVDTGINSYPSTQTFSSSTLFPPTGWRRPDTTTWWAWSGVNGYGVTGSGSIVDRDSWETGTSTRIDAPFLNLGAYGGTLTFDHAYAHYAPYEPAYKDLKILGSLDGGKTFSELATFSGATGGDLITAPAAAAGVTFVPASTQWATKTIQIPPGVNILRFATQNQYGNGYLYLDNVKFTKYLFASGTGTEADPYLVSNASELDLIRNYLGSASSRTYFKLTADIDLTSFGNAWVPIGTNTAYFYGGLDGDNHTISNLRLQSYGSYHGLFGITAAGSIIKNLNLASTCYILGDTETGSITGRNNGTIQNCRSAATVNIGNAEAGGGLVGLNNGTITGSSFSGSVAKSGGTVVSNKLGGIAGNNPSGAIITNCSSSGTISGSTWNGGLVGWNDGTINRSFSAGAVNCNNNTTGGLVGQNNGSINNSFSRVNVTGANYVGGLVGYHGSGSITNCFSTGTVAGGQKGGLIGASGGMVTSSYWDTQTSGMATSYGGTGKTSAQMKTQSTYTGWDFTIETTNGTNDYWNINPADNNGYPDLIWRYANEIRSPVLLSPANNAYGVSKNNVVVSWSPNPVGLSPHHYTVYLIKDNLEWLYLASEVTDFTGTSFNFSTDSDITFNYGETWYWTVVAHTANGTASPAPAGFGFHIQRDPFATESFEVGCIDGTTNISEWTQSAEAGSSPWTANSAYNSGSLAPRTGAFNVYMFHSGGEAASTWLFHPVTLIGSRTYDLELYARQQLLNPNYGSVGMYFGTSASIAAMTNSIVGQTFLDTTEYKRIAGSFTPSSSGTYYLGIKGYIAGGTNYLSMDDVTLSVTRPSPVTLNAPAHQSTFVSTLPSFSWTAPTAGIPPDSYKLCISTVNPPNPANLSATVTAPATSYTLPESSRLQPATTYYWSVISEAQSQLSTNNAVFSFTTMPVDAFTENFETGSLPGGWTIHNVDGGTKSWEVSSLNPVTGTYSASISAEPSRQNDDWLITPRLGGGATTADNFRFSLRKIYSNYPEEFEVLVSTTDTQPSSFTMIGSGTLPDLQVLTLSYNLDAYDDNLIYLAIRYRGNYENGICLDDVFGPAVYSSSGIDIAATSITGRSALGIGRPYEYTVGISNNGMALQTGYTVYLKSHNPEATIASYAMPALAGYATTTHTFTWIPDSSYLGTRTLYAEVILAGDTVTANNVTPGLPVTIALQEMLNEGFELGMIPANWTVLNVDSGTSQWSIGGGSSIHSGSYGVQVWYEGNVESDDWIITPALMLSTSRVDTISFWMRGYTSGAYDPWEVLISTTDTNPASFTMIDSGVSDASWVQKTYNLDAYGNAVVYIAIRALSWDLFMLCLDDFVGPPLFTPGSGLDTPTVSISSSGSIVTLSWDAVAGATEYRVFSSDDLQNWSSNYTTVTAPNHSLSVSAATIGRKFFKVVAWNSSSPAAGAATQPAMMEPQYQDRMFRKTNR